MVHVQPAHKILILTLLRNYAYHARIPLYIILQRKNVNVQLKNHTYKIIIASLVIRQDSGMEQIVFLAHQQKYITSKKDYANVQHIFHI